MKRALRMTRKRFAAGCFTLLLAAGLLGALWFSRPPYEMPATPPPALWRGFSYDGVYTLSVDPPTALRDAPMTIRAAGFQPAQPVTLRAAVTDANGLAWESFATFKADDRGVVDPASASPLYGTYTQSDAMGLFWSMLPVGERKPQAEMFSWPSLDPIVITISAEADGKTLSSVTVERLPVLDATRVTRQPLDADGLVGTLFYPNDGQPHPAILVLGGSEGGLDESRAALLASHGYAALALAYFGVDPLPAQLMDIPLEYFESALAWLKQQPAVDVECLAVVGGSKGGELALLLAATYPADIKAVVAYVPSGVVWQGIPRGFRSTAPSSSWTQGGQPLPFVNVRFQLDNFSDIGNGIAMRTAYERGLDDAAAVEAATIPVEKINGPVLLISGADDQLWPSTTLADRVIAQLEASQHPFAHEHLSYEGAGHLIGIPYFPSITTQAAGLNMGGNAEANAAASADAWPKVLKFLAENLRQEAGTCK